MGNIDIWLQFLEKRCIMDKLVEVKDNIVENISKVIIGKEKEIELLIVAFLSGGHVLLEGIPEISRTVIAKTFSKTLHLQYNRIDFTPDLLPTDITGVNYYDQVTGDFQFKEGKLFSNIVFINEINRGNPRIQSVLFEAMQEKQITIDGLTRQFQLPFMVLASQSKVDSFGTYPLPDAKLDRFFMRIKLDYRQKENEESRVQDNDALNNLKSVASYKEIMNHMESIKYVKIDNKTMDYLIEIVDQTRKIKDLDFRISPRGSIDLYKAARTFAAINGRKYVTPKDVKVMAPHILNHRIIGKDIEDIEEANGFIRDRVSKIKVPEIASI